MRQPSYFPPASKIGSPVLDVIDESFEDISITRSSSASIRTYRPPSVKSQLKRTTSLYSQRSLRSTNSLDTIYSAPSQSAPQLQRSQSLTFGTINRTNRKLSKQQYLDDRNATNFLNNSQRQKLKKRQQLNQQQIKEKQQNINSEINDLIKNTDFLSDDELPDDLIVYDVPFARPLKVLADKENVFRKSSLQINNIPSEHQQRQIPYNEPLSDPSSTTSSSTSLTNHTPGQAARASMSSLSTRTESTRASSIFSFGSEISDLTDVNEKKMSNLSLDAKTLTFEFEQNKEFQKHEESIQRINYLKRLGNINSVVNDYNQQFNPDHTGIKLNSNSKLGQKESKEKLQELSITRPVYLPPKDKYESFKHKKEYESLLQKVIEKEANEQLKRNRSNQMKLKQQSKDSHTWKTKILPSYTKMVELPSTRELWWRGIPSESLRSAIWCRQLGNKLCIDEEKLNSELIPKANSIISKACDYQILIDMNKRFEAGKFSRDNEDTIEMIKLVGLISKEIKVCFPDLMIFQIGFTFESILSILLTLNLWMEHTEEGKSSLLNRLKFKEDLLLKYKITHLTCVLFQNIKDESKTIIALTSLLTKKLPYSLMVDEDLHPEYLKDTLESFDKCLLKTNQSVHSHFNQASIGLKSIEFLRSLIPNFFCTMTTYDNACRLLDIYLFEGDSFLLRVMLSIIKRLNYKLFGKKEEIMNVLSCNNQNHLNSDLINHLQEDNKNSLRDSKQFSTHGYKYLDLGDDDDFIKDVRTILRK